MQIYHFRSVLLHFVHLCFKLYSLVPKTEGHPRKSLQYFAKCGVYLYLDKPTKCTSFVPYTLSLSIFLKI